MKSGVYSFLLVHKCEMPVNYIEVPTQLNLTQIRVELVPSPHQLISGLHQLRGTISHKSATHQSVGYSCLQWGLSTMKSMETLIPKPQQRPTKQKLIQHCQNAPSGILISWRQLRRTETKIKERFNKLIIVPTQIVFLGVGRFRRLLNFDCQSVKYLKLIEYLSEVQSCTFSTRCLLFGFG